MQPPPRECVYAEVLQHPRGMSCTVLGESPQCMLEPHDFHVSFWVSSVTTLQVSFVNLISFFSAYFASSSVTRMILKNRSERVHWCPLTLGYPAVVKATSNFLSVGFHTSSARDAQGMWIPEISFLRMFDSRAVLSYCQTTWGDDCQELCWNCLCVGAISSLEVNTKTLWQNPSCAQGEDSLWSLSDMGLFKIMAQENQAWDQGAGQA